mmetsp:Transcript_2170/g.6264  ORF Transcript_2170/g.6264 Transcript_2170/m.6264 type:complete len:246 (+) Transcript_2170:243-980(+)
MPSFCLGSRPWRLGRACKRIRGRQISAARRGEGNGPVNASLLLALALALALAPLALLALLLLLALAVGQISLVVPAPHSLDVGGCAIVPFLLDEAHALRLRLQPELVLSAALLVHVLVVVLLEGVEANEVTRARVVERVKVLLSFLDVRLEARRPLLNVCLQLVPLVAQKVFRLLVDSPFDLQLLLNFLDLVHHSALLLRVDARTCLLARGGLLVEVLRLDLRLGAQVLELLLESGDLLGPVLDV